jgi:hypothetical protein
MLLVEAVHLAVRRLGEPAAGVDLKGVGAVAGDEHGGSGRDDLRGARHDDVHVVQDVLAEVAHRVRGRRPGAVDERRQVVQLPRDERRLVVHRYDDVERDRLRRARRAAPRAPASPPEPQDVAGHEEREERRDDRGPDEKRGDLQSEHAADAPRPA